jgi:hypothetical protein
MYNIPEISNEEICIHEAAHALIAFLLGFRIISIEINQDEKSGVCWRDFQSNRKPIIPELQGISEFEKHIMVCCAGHASKAIITDNDEHWEESADYAHALQELKPKYDEKIIKLYIESIVSWVIELLKQYWDVVDTLADALLWLPERSRFDDYPGSDFEDQLPLDYFEEPQEWEMPGKEVEDILSRALTNYEANAVTKK